MILRHVFSLTFITFLSTIQLFAQSTVTGTIKDNVSNELLPGVLVEVEGTDQYAQTSISGVFTIEGLEAGEISLLISAEGYELIRSSFTVKLGSNDLGEISLKPSFTDENTDSEDLVPTIMLSDEEVESGSSGTQTVSGILNARRDIFTSKVAFAWSVARFRIRGYDSDNTQLYMNGIQMNDLESGRPTWWTWSGLNDVTRNRNSVIGLGVTDFASGDIGGASFLDVRASKQRKQFRVTYTFANRSYNHRLMATYNTGVMENGWAFSFSGSYRLSDQGPWTYIKGATYNGGSYFVGVEKIINNKHSIALNVIGSPNVRGKGGPAVQEMFDLAGTNYYNPNWGYQTAPDGRQLVRNSRMTDSHQPLFLLSHESKINEDIKLHSSVSYQFGKYGSTALDWYNAEDPRPDYYRKLPSYIEDPYQQQLATDLLMNNESLRQIQWDRLYDINRNAYEFVADPNGVMGDTLYGNRSRYIVEERRYDSQKANAAMWMNAKVNDFLRIDGGLSYQFYNSRNFKVVDDLLGGDFYVDINRFVQRDSANSSNPDVYQNDVDNPNRILAVGDVFGYDYEAIVHKARAWAQAAFTFKKIDFFLSGQGEFTSFYRKGNMRNGLFPDNSFGLQDPKNFFTYGTKAGLTYKIDGRNYVFANASYQTKAPYFRYTYISPRVRDQIISENLDSLISSNYSFEAGYMLRSPKIKARAVAYYTKFVNRFYQRSFYLDLVTTTDAGGAFVNYIMRGIDQQHMGIEIAAEYKFDMGLSISAAASIGEYTYTTRPQASFFLDNDPTTEIDTRTVYLKDFYIPNTPQMTYNIGATYRSKKYWMLSVNFNYFHRSFVDVNPDRRTLRAVSYTPNPDVQQQAVEPGSELWESILAQEELPGRFTCDLFFSKSWKVDNYFIYLNIGVSNILNATDIRTSGFEQYRFDYAEKNVDKFPPKYYYAYGTNFMVQVAFRI